MTEDEVPVENSSENSPEDDEECPDSDSPYFDLPNYLLKIDHFSQIQVLTGSDIIEGAPNFRGLRGFPIFGTGQPTEEAFLKILEKIPKVEDGKILKVKWYNMRQEPVLYINGLPYAPRDPKNPHANIEIEDAEPEMLDNLQRAFTTIIQSRVDEDPNNQVKVHKDSSFIENPMERQDMEESVKVNSVVNFEEILENLKATTLPGLEVIRIPVAEERAPMEKSFDLMVNTLKGETASTTCVFSCQMGRGRTTLGMVIASLIKEVQLTAELNKMAVLGLVSEETVADLIKTKFETPLPTTQDDDDPFIKGEFEVIKELLEKHPEMKEGKKKIDYVININGPSPKGIGIQNLRECIIETKWKYDVAAEEKQGVLRQMILNFLERYFYLICFSTYTLEQGPGGFLETFVSWMDKRKTLREMIENGKDKLEWYRQVDPAKLNTLKELINSPDYKDNMGKLIKTVYDFAFQTYADLPRGPIKNNSMRKLAAKTLLEILPPDIAQNVNKKMEEQQNTSFDFVTLIGLVSYYGEDAEHQ